MEPAATRPWAMAENRPPSAMGSSEPFTPFCSTLHTLGHSQLGQNAGQQAHAEHGEEPHHQTIQALGTGDDLQDHHLTELAGVLAQKAGAGLTGQAGALGGADAAEHRRQAGAQQGQGQAADAAQNRHALVNFRHLREIHFCFLLNL